MRNNENLYRIHKNQDMIFTRKKNMHLHTFFSESGAIMSTLMTLTSITITTQQYVILFYTLRN